MGFRDRIAHAWNAFVSSDELKKSVSYAEYGPSYSNRADRSYIRTANKNSIITSIYNRLAVDSGGVFIRHIRQDENEQFIENIASGLNECLNVAANVDQKGSAFRIDIVQTLIEKGTIAIVPIETDVNPEDKDGGYDIRNLRVGEIVQWYASHVRVRVYNEKLGLQQEIVLPKATVAIVENPFYSIMNEPNSTLQRLIRKLDLLDAVDEASSSGKLDLIIQLPYAVKSDTRRQQARSRRDEMESQLKDSKYGVAYADVTEKITQLNRPAENNMLAQVQYLTEMLYSQLGLTETIMNGTADEATMLNYYNRTIEPLLRAVTESMAATFLTKNARSRGQTVSFFIDPFKLVPITKLAELADKLTRNEILSSNEFRGIIGYRPSKDPNADKLLNKNLPIKEAPTAEIEEKPLELKQINP